ncbi:MAG: helix-turn-helix transcriptional regulator [Thermoplasmata archaeon]|nr:helix-turn-helix transcriptional regulator [Thermoplasmata archaeon]
MTRFDGALLRARRETLGLTIEELSDLTGLTRRRRYTVLMDLESGAIQPSVVALGKLCRALGVDPSALFSGEPDDDADDRPTDLGEATDRAIAELLAAAPPMTDRQAARMSAILFGGAS